MTDIPFEAGEIWQISFELADRTGVEVFEAVLDDVVIGVSSFEIVGTTGWRITGYTAGEPNHADILARLGTAAATSYLAVTKVTR